MPIRETIDHLRDALSWLGEPVVKQKKNNNTLVFKAQPTDVEAGEIHLKVEINCKEHFSVFPMVRKPFEVSNSWYSGQCELLTYELEELTGTKLRAVYQRRKGHDLFDLWKILSLTQDLDKAKVMTAYEHPLRNVHGRPLGDKGDACFMKWFQEGCVLHHGHISEAIRSKSLV